MRSGGRGVAGALTLEDAARVIVMRSQLFADELVGRGGIASISLSANEIGNYLVASCGQLELAGSIGPRTVTVAGAQAALDELMTKLRLRGVPAKVIPASIPSHCALVEPLRERLTGLLDGIRPQPSRIPIYSTVTGALVDGERLTADYWYANARKPVVFGAVMRQLLADGCRVFVESSAHPVLVTAMAATAMNLAARRPSLAPCAGLGRARAVLRGARGRPDPGGRD